MSREHHDQQDTCWAQYTRPQRLAVDGDPLDLVQRDPREASRVGKSSGDSG